MLKMSALITVVLLLGSFEVQAGGGIPDGGSNSDVCLENTYDFRISEYKCQIKVTSGQNIKSYDFDDILSLNVSEWVGRYPEYPSYYFPEYGSRGYGAAIAYAPLTETYFTLQAYGGCNWLTKKPDPRSVFIKLSSTGGKNSPTLSWGVELKDPSIVANGTLSGSVPADTNTTVQVSCQKR